jgi:hypothetical protein
MPFKEGLLAKGRLPMKLLRTVQLRLLLVVFFPIHPLHLSLTFHLSQ